MEEISILQARRADAIEKTRANCSELVASLRGKIAKRKQDVKFANEEIAVAQSSVIRLQDSGDGNGIVDALGKITRLQQDIQGAEKDIQDNVALLQAKLQEISELEVEWEMNFQRRVSRLNPQMSKVAENLWDESELSGLVSDDIMAEEDEEVEMEAGQAGSPSLDMSPRRKRGRDDTESPSPSDSDESYRPRLESNSFSPSPSAEDSIIVDPVKTSHAPPAKRRMTQNRGGWSIDEKYTLLSMIVNQIKLDRPINYTKLNMPGRTPKACQHMWAKIKAGGSGWSIGETYTFLLRIISQFSDRQPIRFDKIDMPGRTPKALMHVWAKIRQEAYKFAEASANDSILTTRQGPRRSQQFAVEDDGNDKLLLPHVEELHTEDLHTDKIHAEMGHSVRFNNDASSADSHGRLELPQSIANPPQHDLPPSLDSNQTVAAEADTAMLIPPEISANDVEFLMNCLLQPTGGTVLIDTNAVAAARGLKNRLSVANRIASIKKKYNLPIGAVKTSNRKYKDSASLIAPYRISVQDCTKRKAPTATSTKQGKNIPASRRKVVTAYKSMTASASTILDLITLVSEQGTLLDSHIAKARSTISSMHTVQTAISENSKSKDGSNNGDGQPSVEHSEGLRVKPGDTAPDIDLCSLLELLFQKRTTLEKHILAAVSTKANIQACRDAIINKRQEEVTENTASGSPCTEDVDVVDTKISEMTRMIEHLEGEVFPTEVYDTLIAAGSKADEILLRLQDQRIPDPELIAQLSKRAKAVDQGHLVSKGNCTAGKDDDVSPDIVFLSTTQIVSSARPSPSPSLSPPQSSVDRTEGCSTSPVPNLGEITLPNSEATNDVEMQDPPDPASRITVKESYQLVSEDILCTKMIAAQPDFEFVDDDHKLQVIADLAESLRMCLEKRLKYTPASKYTKTLLAQSSLIGSKLQESTGILCELFRGVRTPAQAVKLLSGVRTTTTITPVQMAPLTLTAKERQLMSAFISQLDGLPKVDWGAIAPQCGQKYARNARTAFIKVWEKIRSNGINAMAHNRHARATGDDDDN